MTLRPPSDPTHFRTQVGRYRERFYIDPLPADDTWPEWDAAVPSVSTVKGAWPKHLVPWATKAVATFAVDNQDRWLGLERQAAIDLLAGASDRTRDKAAARGTGVHHVLEQLAAGQEPMVDLIPDVEPYLPACRQLIHDLQPTWVATEAVAISREPGWGGTFDAIITSDVLGGTFLVDWKTRTAGKSLGAYDDEAAQLAAYAASDYLIVAGDDGAPVRRPMPHLDGACIVAIGTDGYKCVPVVLDDATALWEALWSFWHAKANIRPVGKPLHTFRAADDPTPTAEAAPALEAVLRRRAWISSRVAAIKAAGGVDDMRTRWPTQVPTPKVGGWDDAQIDAIDKALQPVESALKIPFDPDPARRTEPTPLDMTPREPNDDDLVNAYWRRLRRLPNEARAAIAAEWTGPALVDDDITEDQLGEFGVLLARYEAEAVAS